MADPYRAAVRYALARLATLENTYGYLDASLCLDRARVRRREHLRGDRFVAELAGLADQIRTPSLTTGQAATG